MLKSDLKNQHLFAFILLILVGACPLFAAVYYASPTTIGSGNSLDWTNAGNLHDALALAGTGDEVWAKSGNYLAHSSNTETSFAMDTEGVNLFGGFVGSETLVSERDWVQNPTVLEGEIQGDADQTNNSNQILHLYAANLMIDGLIIQNGFSSDRGAGADVNDNGSNVNIYNTIFRNHIAVNDAAALNLLNTNASGTVRNCVFENNQLTAGTGDGAAMVATGPVQIINSVFVGNHAPRDGGAIKLINTSGSNIINCVFDNNSAGGSTGAVYINQDASIYNSIFWGNDAPVSPGVYITGGTVTIYNSIIQAGNSMAWPSANVGVDGGENINEDPRFSGNANPAGADGKWFTADDGLFPLYGSPAIDSGNRNLPIQVSQDITGRFKTSLPDMGAYEITLGGTALHFNGDLDEKVIVPDSASLQWSGNITAESWLFVDSVGSGNRAVFGKDHPSIGGFSMYINNAGRAAFFIKGNGDGSTVVSRNFVPVDKWFLLTGIFDDVTKEHSIYINGSPEKTVTASSNLSIDNTGGSNLHIGQLSDGTSPFIGDIDNVALWSEVRSPEDFGKPLTGSEANLVAHYNFDNIGSGNILSDLSPNDNDGVIYDALQVGSMASTTVLPKLYLRKTGFMAPSTLVASASNLQVLEFKINGSNATRGSNLQQIQFEVISGDLSNDIVGAELFDVNTSSSVSSMANMTSGNIVFENLNFGLSAGGNQQLSLRIDTPSGFAGDNLQLGLQANDILFDKESVLGRSLKSTYMTVLTNIKYSDNLMFNSPTTLTAGSVNVELANYHLFNPDIVSQSVNTITIDVLSGNGQDLVDLNLRFYSGSELVNGTTRVFTHLSDGNILIDFDQSPFVLSAGANYHYTLLATIENPSSDNVIQLSMDPSKMITSDGKPVDGASVDFGLMNIIMAGNTSGNGMSGNVEITHMAAGQYAVYAVDFGGNVKVAGYNHFGQLGLNSGSRSGATYMDTGYTKISAGAEHAIGLKENGQVFSFGSNIFGQAVGGTDNLPQLVNISDNVIDIVAGAYTSYALTENNDIYAWGRGSTGALGTGDLNDEFNPTLISKPTGNIMGMAAGVDHFLVLIGDVIYGAGSDGFGQQKGSGDKSTLTMLDGTRSWKTVGAGGFHSFAIDASGDLYSWGRNDDGQLAHGYQSLAETVPTMVTGIGSMVIFATGGHAHSLIHTSDGRALSVGANGSGQLGIAGPDQLGFTQVNGYTDVDQISCGPYTSMLVRAGQYVKLWGRTPTGPSSTLQVYLQLLP